MFQEYNSSVLATDKCEDKLAEDVAQHMPFSSFWIVIFNKLTRMKV